MPFEHALWRIEANLGRLTAPVLEDEAALEDYICAEISSPERRWMIVGRQIHTDHGKIIDLLPSMKRGR